MLSKRQEARESNYISEEDDHHGKKSDSSSQEESKTVLYEALWKQFSWNHWKQLTTGGIEESTPKWNVVEIWLIGSNSSTISF